VDFSQSGGRKGAVIRKHAVAEYNPARDLSDNNAALATGTNFPSPIKTSKSSSISAALKPTIATKDIWSARLGHPSEQAISRLADVNLNIMISNIASKPLNEVKNLLSQISVCCK
jgi:hypothetical protein